MRFELPCLGGAPPNGWTTPRNRSLFSVIEERSLDGAEELLTVSHLTGVSPRAEKRHVNMFLAESLEGYKKCAVGDLVINTMWAWMGALGVTNYEGIVSPSYHVYRFKVPRTIEPRFFDYFYRTPGYVKEIIRNSRGVWTSRLRLYPSEFLDMETWVPPLPTQKAIANFLDRKTAAIDALIEKKEKLLELLAEKRSALINQAVTKGLDPSVPMKDSGIPWIGEIPEHWEVCCLKHLVGDPPHFGIQMGPFGSSLTSVLREPTPYFVFGQANTISGNFDEVSRWISLEQFSDLEKYIARPGDIVLTRKGSIGNCRLIPDNVPQGIIDSDTIRVRLDPENLFPEFVVSLLHSAEYLAEQLSSQSRGAIIPGLNTKVIGDLKILVPPLAEQRVLQHSIHLAEARAAREKEVLTKQLDRLHEYRQSLITAAVTGQLKIPDEDYK